jgi:hypothetical protein
VSFCLNRCGARVVLDHPRASSRVRHWVYGFPFLVNFFYGQIPRVLIAVATRWMPTM